MSSHSGSNDDYEYPRHLHPGGFSLPPLVEDRLSIVTTPSAKFSNNQLSPTTDAQLLQTNLLLVKPTDMESLWEWYAYTKRQHDADPSWGRVWPTALALSRWILRALQTNTGSECDTDGGIDIVTDEGNDNSLMKRARHSLQTSSHIVEVGCGLGVAGLTYATTVASSTNTNAAAGGGDDMQQPRRVVRHRTITFLDKEPYALHCVMASAAVNGISTGPIIPQSQPSSLAQDIDAAETSKPLVDKLPLSNVVITARAAIDDWSLPFAEEGGTSMEESKSSSAIKNICYTDLLLDDGVGTQMDEATLIVLASDILYEPSSMESLANKLHKLVHPTHGGYILIADPERERTPGCRVTFVECIRNLGGEVEIFPLEDSGVTISSENLVASQTLLLDASDIDIDGRLARTVLIVVHFPSIGIQ